LQFFEFICWKSSPNGAPPIRATRSALPKEKITGKSVVQWQILANEPEKAEQLRSLFGWKVDAKTQEMPSIHPSSAIQAQFYDNHPF